MRDQSPSELAPGVAAHSLQRLVSEPQAKIINHVGLSSGKDSTALWGWIINDSGYPIETIRGTACDTENEYQEFYDQIKTLDEYGKKRGVAPIRILKSEGFLALTIRKHSFPSAKSRFCTEVLKSEPTLHYFEELRRDGYEIVNHTGVRADESTERSMLQEWGEQMHCKVRRPMLKWTLDEVWKAHRKYGLPINPLYLKGKKRVGCKLCCMSSKYDVRNTTQNFPETIEEIYQWEQLITKSRASRKGGNPDYASFFHATTIPEIQRSQTYQKEDGTMIKVGTIKDVARWSLTLRGGTQGGFDFMFEEDDAGAPCKMGYCE